MKKLLSLVLCLLLVLGFAATAMAEDSGKITFYFWDEAQKPAMQDVVKGFNEIYPDIEVEITVIPWGQYWTKLQTSLGTANGPDCMWLNKNYVQVYAAADLLEPLEGYIEAAGTDMSVFPQALKDIYTQQGHVVGIPKDYDTIGLFYNKSIFDAAGVAYPTNDWTWDDVAAAAETLTANGIHGFAVALDDTQSYVEDLVFGAAGQVVTEDTAAWDFNNDGAKAAFEWSMDLLGKGYSPSYFELQEISAHDRFQAGLLAMYQAGSWNAATYCEALGAENVGVVEIPSKVQEANVIHGLGICINKASENKDLAFKFASYFATAEAAEAQAQVVIPAHNAGAEQWLAKLPIDATCFTNAAQIATPIAAPTVEYAKQSELYNTWALKIWTGEVGVEEGLASLTAESAALAGK